MLATVGYRVGKSGLCFPGDIPYDGTKFSAVGGGFDALGMYDVTDDGKFVGDVRNGFIDFGWGAFDEETQLQKIAIELNNGRAAMMGILALMVHEKLAVPLIPDLF